MAEAPGHRLGQIIGDVLELALEPALQEFADEHNLFLDKKGPREARSGKKVAWKDGLGNVHDLDYVLERGGSDEKIGVPVAFIEVAWRRYTKHSRNKAQEIQGAVLPLVSTYAHVKPFPAVVLAGVFTSGSISQLKSNGFAVLYVPYGVLVSAFRNFGVDIDYNESTPDDHLRAQIDAYGSLSPRRRVKLGEALREAVSLEFATFRKSLEKSVLRRIATVSVSAMHAEAITFKKIGDAIASVRNYQIPQISPPLVRFEIAIRYTNDDRIVADFADPEDAISFLESFNP